MVEDLTSGGSEGKHSKTELLPLVQSLEKAGHKWPQTAFPAHSLSHSQSSGREALSSRCVGYQSVDFDSNLDWSIHIFHPPANSSFSWLTYGHPANWDVTMATCPGVMAVTYH
ncbi:hypothetical protein E2C01_029500 [Portunus trituberculatus]|uniref:Uncharacterized protein n=1 Tax=Portunus trituberculatus TaxID=210409 RepID=A0A5B7EUS1_PORTR|nr:hypothetical protein [Portunus trituberculatus]